MTCRTAAFLVLTVALAPAQQPEIPELRNVQQVLKAGRVRDAAEAAERVISQYPNRHEPYVWAARAWGNLRRFQRMVDHLKMAHQLAPDDPTILLNLATGLYNQAKWSEALFFLRKLDSLIARLGPQGARQSGQWKVPWMRGICAVKLDHIPEGIRAYSRALGLTSDPQQRNQIRNRLAGALLNSGRTEDAIVHFAQLVQDNPGNPDNHYHLGVGRLKTGDLDGAETALMEARRRNPKDYRIAQKIGTLHQRRGDLLKAQTFFQLSTEANPKAYEPWYSLLQLYSRRNDLDEADKAHARYEELYALAKEAEEQSRKFSRSIKNDSGNPDNYFEYALFLLTHGKIQEAEERLLQLLAIDPRHDRAIINIAQILVREQRFQEAILEFEKVLERDPDHPIANLECARGHYQLRQLPQAFMRIRRVFARIDRHKEQQRYLTALAMYVNLAIAVRQPADVLPEIQKAVGIFDSDANMLGKLLPTYGRLATMTNRTREFFEAAEPSVKVLGADHPDYKAVIESILRAAQKVNDAGRTQRYSELLGAIQ